jgi:hypothetical protein
VPCLTTIVVLHNIRASYICILLVISFLIKLTCIVLRNRLSNVARESRKCQAFAHFLHWSGWSLAQPERYTVNSRLRLKDKVQLFSAQFSAQFTRNCPFVWKADGLE